MKILVLGSVGFIGRRLTDRLSMDDETITADITADNRGRHVVIDSHEPDLIGLFDEHRPDLVVNCTGAAHVGASITDPAHDYELNVRRVQQILESIRQVGCRCRFIHLSSAAVYGNPVSLPVAESAAAAPLSPYGFHKLQAEMLCREYAQIFGVPTLSLRIFSAYGPELRKQLFWDIYQKSLHGQRIELSGTGNETRDFVFVKDIARAVASLRDHPDLFDGQAVNLASGQATTIRQAARTLLDALGWQGELVFNGQVRAGDPLFWQADISALARTGYRQQFTLEQGLTQVAAWLKDL